MHNFLHNLDSFLNSEGMNENKNGKKKFLLTNIKTKALYLQKH